MRKSLLILTSFSTITGLMATALALATVSAHGPHNGTNVRPLTPRPSQVLIARVFYDEVRHFHYPPVVMSVRRGRAILKEYLHLLDPDHYFFTAPQVQRMDQTYGQRLNVLLARGDIRPAFHIYRLYRRQAVHFLRFATTYLKKSHYRFPRQGTFVYAREHAPWAPNEQELEHIWKERLLSQLVMLIANGKSIPQAQHILRRRYTHELTRLEKIPQHRVFDTFMTAFAKGIDPHTSYFSPIAEQQFSIAMSLKLHGIGTQLTEKDGYPTIVRVLPGGPAAKSKELHPGDRITAVGEGRHGAMKDVVGRTLESVVEMIRGPKNTIVRLRILPAGSPPGGHEFVVSLVRGTIRLKSGAAHARMTHVPLDGHVYNVGVLTLPTFYLDFKSEEEGRKHYRSAYRDMKRLILKLEKEGMNSLVLELRNNGGGSLREAARTIGLFIQGGPVVQIMSAEGRQVMEDPDRGPLYRGPVVILVNRLSASATEIFTAALKDYHRAIVMGSRTYGKGTVQTLISLHRLLPGLHAGEIKLTIAKFYRITGDSTQDRGIRPDIEIPSIILDSEFGEEDSPNALPWSKISPARYHVMHVGLDRVLPTIEREFHAWATTNARYKLYVKTVEMARHDERIDDIPLNPEAYAARRRHHDQRQLAIDNAWLRLEHRAPVKSLAQLRGRHFRIPDIPLIAAEHVAAQWASLAATKTATTPTATTNSAPRGATP